MIYKILQPNGKYLTGPVKDAFFDTFPKKVKGSICEAPFRSLRFAHTGNVLSCCYNRGHVLGKYPDDSLHDIWFGKRLKALRQALKNHDFQLGCESCVTNIEGGNFHSSGLHQYDYLCRAGKTEKKDLPMGQFLTNDLFRN